MEVMCLTCKKMFSVDDNKYKGEWENFCGIQCQNKWFEEKQKQGDMSYDGVDPFVWTLEDKTNGK